MGSAKTTKTREERLLTRLRQAQRTLTEDELQFFPKTNSMPDQPKSQWMPSEQAAEALADRDYGSAQK